MKPGVILMPMDTAHLQRIQELQSQFWKRLECQAKIETKPVPVLLSRILDYDDEIVELSLGNVGKKLKSFAQDIDFLHPGLGLILDGALSDDRDFSKECLELLMLTQFAKEHQLNYVLPSIKTLLSNNSFVKDISKRIDRPTFNRLHVRLLKNPEERTLCRSTKQAQVIELRNLYRKGEEAWTLQPDSFRMFLRFDKAYEEEIAKAEKKAERFYALGCTAMGDEIQQAVDDFKSQVSESYYGFNRITMSNAAVVLAKSLGYSLSPGEVFSSNKRHIQVERSFFGNYQFDPVCLEDTYACITPFVYEPRVYPLHDFWHIAPDTVKKTISHLDEFPEADNKPIFDHFCLIVPTVRFPISSSVAEDDQEVYCILDESLNKLEFSSREEAQRALDFILVKGGYFHPIIIGEKDSKCYFISYWWA